MREREREREEEKKRERGEHYQQRARPMGAVISTRSSWASTRDIPNVDIGDTAEIIRLQSADISNHPCTHTFKWGKIERC